jgi:molecular chaperone GrpE
MTRKTAVKQGKRMSEEAKSTPTDEPQGNSSRREAGSEEHGGPGSSEDGQTAQTVAPEAEDTPGDVGSRDAPERMDQQSLEERLEGLQAEVAEQKDRYLRAVAEAENIRRRADNDISSARKFAIEAFASEVLVVRDSLEIARSLEIAENDAGAVAKMKEGLDLTLKQLDSVLSKFAIQAVDPQAGDKLDPERHQAMTTQESTKVPPNHILSVIQKGYTIHDRLLRPAMVVVAKKPQGESQTKSGTA